MKMYYADLSECTYFDSTRSDKLLAIGWLDSEHEFATGSVSPVTFMKLKECYSIRWSSYSHRGFHQCEFCPADRSATSSHCILIPGRDVVYASPAMITHYIKDHRYQPPHQFLEAVRDAPQPGTREFNAALERNGVLIEAS